MSERAAASRSEGRRCGEKIRDERHACEQVEQCKRLSDPSVSNKGFELNAHQITQEQFFLPVTGDWVNLHHHRQGEINGISCFVTDSIASLVYTILISEQCHCVGPPSAGVVFLGYELIAREVYTRGHVHH